MHRTMQDYLDECINYKPRATRLLIAEAWDARAHAQYMSCPSTQKYGDPYTNEEDQ
jgi:hypothetical protein